MNRPRFASRFRGYLLDQHSPDPPVVPLNRVDVRKYIETYKAANIDSLIVYAKGHWGDCYYDTKVGHRHPGPTGDMLAQMVELGHRNNMEVSAYYSLGFDTWAAVQNPDWAQRNEDGSPNLACINPQKWHNMCCNTPYRDYALAQIAEIAGGYDVDGFFIDIFPYHWLYGICYCDYCERASHSMFGRRVSELSWNERVEWTGRQRKVLWNEIQGTVRRLRPEAYVIVNGHFYTEIVRCEDYVYTEAAAGTGLPTLLARGCGLKHHQIGPGALSPVWDPRSVAACKLDISGILAYGGRAMVYSEAQHPDGTLEHSFLDILGEVYSEVRQKQEFVEDAEPIKSVGVVSSDATLLYHAKSDYGEEFHKPLEGAVDAILKLHRPVDVLFDWRIAPEELDAFDVVVLPDVVCLDDRQADAVRDYVWRGGRLLATFKTSLKDGEGNLRANFALADVFGVDYLADDATYTANPFGSYLRYAEDEVTADLAGATLGMPGPFLKVGATSGRSIGWHTLPVTAQTADRFVNWGSPPPGMTTQFPVIHMNEFGSGRVVYVTAPIFRYIKDGMNWPKRLAANVLEWLDPTPSVCVDGPSFLEATFSRQPEADRLVVHFLNRSISLYGDEAAPVGASLRLRKDRFSVRCARQVWPEKTDLRAEECAGYLKVEIPPVGIHSIVTVTG